MYRKVLVSLAFELEMITLQQLIFILCIKIIKQYYQFQSMFNRLVAENILKTPIKTDPYFSVNKKMLAYSIQSSLKIKSFEKDAKQLELILQQNTKLKTFELSIKKQWLYTITSTNVLTIYSIDKEWKFTKYFQILGVEAIQENVQNLILTCKDKTIRTISLTNIEEKVSNNIKSLQYSELITLIQIKNSAKLIRNNQGKDVFIQTTNNNNSQRVVHVFSQRKINKLQKVLEIDYLKNPVAVYKDRFIFDFSAGSNNLLQIYDIREVKVKGKLAIQGQFRFAKIKQNLLILVMNVENTDYYWCFLLDQNPTQNASLITHRIVYQKGKGDFYSIINMLNSQTGGFLSKKKQLALYLQNEPQSLNNSTSSMIFILGKQKQKTQIVKLDHSKILQSPFVQQKIDKAISPSKKIQNQINQEKVQQNAQYDRAKIHSTIQNANHQRPMEQTQKRFVQLIVDTKLRVILKKFGQLEKRVQSLEKTMKSIYQKIDLNLKNLNRHQIKESVQNLFQQLTPQFQTYFTQLFKQVSGVLDQGASYYNKKMAMEADIHKQALSQIVDRTFQSTEQIIRVSKKQEKLSEKTEDHLKKLIEAKKKWSKKTDQFEEKSKEMAENTGNSIKGVVGTGGDKIFVRADLNAGQKKQT